MLKLAYTAIFEPSEDGSFGIYFPGVPGCYSSGDNFDDGVKMAKEALSFHLSSFLEDGENFPVENSEIEVLEETAPGYLKVPIDVNFEVISFTVDTKKSKICRSLIFS
jgi:predicted RNase H-like HicB family nuclease